MTAMTEVGTDSTDTTSINTYRSMRRGLMIVAFLLPFVLYGVGWWLSGDPWPRRPQSSMSYYYYTGARDVFVGALWAIGVFLILYKPKSCLENFLLNVAGVAACAIALFPMNQDGDCKDSPLSLHSELHGISAVVFFGAITLVCLCFPASRTRQTRWCAGAMVLSVGIALLYKFLLGTESKEFLCSMSIIFWIEVAAVFAFANYWRLKSLDMDGSLKQWPAQAAALVRKDLRAAVQAGKDVVAGVNKPRVLR